MFSQSPTFLFYIITLLLALVIIEASDPSQSYLDCKRWISKYKVVRDKSWGNLPLRYIK